LRIHILKTIIFISVGALAGSGIGWIMRCGGGG
jgi:hypothetical protein